MYSTRYEWPPQYKFLRIISTNAHKYEPHLLLGRICNNASYFIFITVCKILITMRRINSRKWMDRRMGLHIHTSVHSDQNHDEAGCYKLCELIKLVHDPLKKKKREICQTCQLWRNHTVCSMKSQSVSDCFTYPLAWLWLKSYQLQK